MSMKPTDTIIGPRRGTADQAMAFARKIGATRQDDLAMYLSTVYTLAPKVGIDPAIVVAQSALETSNWTGKWWTDRLNPAGIGITGDAAQNAASMTWENGEDAAIGQVIHLYLYAKGWPLPPELAPYAHLDPRRTAIHASNLGNVRTLEDLGTRWAVVPDYGQRISNRAAAIFPDLPDQTAAPEEPMATTMIEHTIPSAPRTIYLPDWVKVQVKWVTHPRTTSRTRVPLQTRSTFHDTANPRTKAAGEWEWLAGGRQGGSLGGYNAIADDLGVIVCQYLNEETWHAGTEVGNQTSWGTELAYGGNTDWNLAFETVCAWHGALLESANRALPNALVLHQFWTGKWCSGQVLNRGLTGAMHQKVAHYYNLARGARTGVSVPVEPTYVTPVPVVDPATNLPWSGDADITVNGNVYEAQKITAKTTIPLNKRQYAGTESQLTGPAYPAGTDVDLLGWVKGELVEGVTEWWVDAVGNRLWAGGIDAEPKQVPDWTELPSELPPGMTGVNGHAYYPLYPDDLTDEQYEALNGVPPPLGRVITVHRDGDMHKWASTASGAVGPVKAGESHIFKYWTRGECLPLTLPDGTEVEECVWYAGDLNSGARMWSGLSTERPD